LFIDLAFAVVILSLIGSAIFRKSAAKRTVANSPWLRHPGTEQRVELVYLVAGIVAVGAGLLEMARYFS
jgi:hypothetical protein